MGIRTHRAEFVAVEFFPVFADTAMLEDDRSRRVVIDPCCDEEKNRRDQKAAADGGGEVEEPLGDLVRCPGEVVPDLEHHDLRIEEGLGGHI